MNRIRAPQDLAASLVFFLIGAAGLVLGWRLAGMKPDGQLGSGTMPMILSLICLGFSGVMALRAFLTDGPPIAPVPWRAVVTVICAIILFGFLIEMIGYVVTAMLTPLVAAFAMRDHRWKEAIIVAILLSIGTSVLFVVLLGQPMPLWWGVQ